MAARSKDKSFGKMRPHRSLLRLRAALSGIAAFVLTMSVAIPLAAAKQPVFATPEKAVGSLLDAIRAGHTQQVMTILGPGSKNLVTSGDPVADAQARAKFLSAYGDKNEIVHDSDTRVALAIGKDDWRFPFPIVKQGQAWRFDARAGAEELLDRRIGANELDAIEVCKAYVAAQYDYAAKDRNHDGYVEYAQKFLSSPGKHDGLYWPSENASDESPLGPLIVSARAEGYGHGTAPKGVRRPYHGYYYKILTGQGPAARDGAYPYIVNGHMIGGFGLVAFPAQYGASGVMTFIVNHDGVVYQKDLGPRTAALASEMTLFNPDSTWKTP